MTILILFFWLFVSFGLFYGSYRANCYFGEKIGKKSYWDDLGASRNEGMQVISFLFMIIFMGMFLIILGTIIVLSVQLGY